MQIEKPFPKQHRPSNQDPELQKKINAHDTSLADMFFSHFLQPKNYINCQNFP